MEKQPAAMLNPLAEVEVAEPATVRVPVAVRLAIERLPERRAEPWTESSEDGVEVPMPNEVVFATMADVPAFRFTCPLPPPKVI